jgi:adenylylsulfate kinase
VNILQKGVTLWFTGLSGSGKTTISRLVEKKLKSASINVEPLDGDILRHHITSELGFSKSDRQKNLERAAYIAKILTRNDIIVLASFISPYKSMRDYCKKEVGSFVEIYVKCSIEECIRRDVKGLYKKALNGEIERFTGISDPFEQPEKPDLVLETDKETARESAAKVVSYLRDKGYIT